MKVLLTVFLILLSIVSYPQQEKAIHWKDDIDFLKKELPAKHLNLFFSMLKEEYSARLDSVTAHLSELNDFEVAIKLTQVVAKAGDSHTAVEFWRLADKSRNLPIQVYWFSNGIFIIQTTKDHEKILGTRLVKINEFSINQVIDSLATLITLENQALLKNKVPSLLPVVQLLKCFKFAKNDTISLGLETSEGTGFSYKLPVGKMGLRNSISVKTDTIPLYFQNQNVFFSERYIEKDKIYYLQYNKCWSKELEEQHDDKVANLPSFKEFENNVFTTLINKNKPVEKLIFDMRFNGGGNSNQGTEFITKLAKFTKINENGKLYVVIGRKTFSSAIINTINFKQYTKAILIGEETGGKPNHYGEVKNFRLPSSQLPINYSTKYFTYTKVELNTIKPDVFIELSFDDYKKGIDPVYEWVTEQK
jgi:hypothetical protein